MHRIYSAGAALANGIIKNFNTSGRYLYITICLYPRNTQLNILSQAHTVQPPCGASKRNGWGKKNSSTHRN